MKAIVLEKTPTGKFNGVRVIIVLAEGEDLDIFKKSDLFQRCLADQRVGRYEAYRFTGYLEKNGKLAGIFRVFPYVLRSFLNNLENIRPKLTVDETTLSEKIEYIFNPEMHKSQPLVDLMIRDLWNRFYPGTCECCGHQHCCHRNRETSPSITDMSGESGNSSFRRETCSDCKTFIRDKMISVA